MSTNPSTPPVVTAVPGNTVSTATTPTTPLYHPDDSKYLQDRAVDLSVAWAEGARSKDEANVRTLLRNPKIVGGALVVAYQAHQSMPNGYYRAHLRNRTASGSKVKASRGPVRPYVPTTLLPNSREPIHIPEGPVKALSLVSNGCPRALGLGGVDAGALIKGTNNLQQEVVDLLAHKPPIYIVFDSNRSSNANVANAAARLARAFMDFGCAVSIVGIPHDAAGKDQGPDDFLAANGAAAYAALVAAAEPADPVLMARLAGPAKAAALLASLPFQASLARAPDQDLTQTAKMLGATIADIEAAIGAFQKRLTRKKHGFVLRKGDSAELSDVYRAVRLKTETVHHGSLHTFDAATGIWVHRDDRALISDIKRMFGNAPIMGANGPRLFELTRVKAKETLEYLKDDGHRPRFFDDAPVGITLKDVFVTVEAGKMVAKPLAPENRARHRHDFRLDPTATCTKWLGYLDQIWEGAEDKPARIECLREFLGAALLGLATNYKKVLLLLGDANTGKSTLLFTIAHLFPAGTVRSVPFQDFTRPFARAPLNGALLNSVGELPSFDILDAEIFKQIVAGDQVEAEYKFKDAFTFKPRCAHIAACNNLPRIADRSEGTWIRFIVLRFDNQFFVHPKPGQRKAIVGFDDQLVTELPGILVWCLKGAKRLLAQGHYTLPSSSTEEVQRWQTDSDQVRAFWEDCIRITNDFAHHVPSEDVWDTYKYWADQARHRCLSKEQFQRAFSRLAERKLGDKGKGKNPKGVLRAYRGIQLKELPGRDQRPTANSEYDNYI